MHCYATTIVCYWTSVLPQMWSHNKKFPWQDFFLNFWSFLWHFLTATKFPDISRFSRQMTPFPEVHAHGQFARGRYMTVEWLKIIPTTSWLQFWSITTLPTIVMKAVCREYLITGGHLGTFLEQCLHKLKVTITYCLQQRRITILHSTSEIG